MTPETLDRLEAQANVQHGKEIATGVIVTAGQLLALIAAYRELHAAQAAVTPAEPA